LIGVTDLNAFEYNKKFRTKEDNILSRVIHFHDETLRDGPQSLWAMRMRYGAYEAVAEDLDTVGYTAIDFPAQAAYLKLATREFKENFWDTLNLMRKKVVKTPITIDIDNCLDLINLEDPPCMIDLWWRTVVKNLGAKKCWSMVGIRDEVKNDLPTLVPLIRELGLKWSPACAYAISPRHTDEHYVKLVEGLMPYKPDSIWIKDADGLLTPERAKTLIPAMMKAANGVPIELHSHGCSTMEPALICTAMQLGVDTIHTCVRPLAFGTSKCAIDLAVKNAHSLGFETDVNLDRIGEIERKLTMIAKEDNLPIGRPMEFDVRTFKHMIPGGVISNTVYQLEKLGIPDKIDEVLEEVPRIHAEMGYPVMITPPSQFIVSQAAVNVATGERYKVVLNCMVDMALGRYGVDDAGLADMDQNLKDRLLSTPTAKARAKKFEEMAERAHEVTVEQIRRDMGMMDASDEDFLYAYVMNGDKEVKACTTPKQYYTGANPLGLLLHRLGKDHDISRLEMKR
jgi:oxaloacetate decarboxylase (Na+ extruding) subunit alpha